MNRRLDSSQMLLHSFRRLRFVLPVSAIASVVVMIASTVPERKRLWTSPYRSAVSATNEKHSEEKRRAEIKQRFEQGVAMLQMGEYEHAITAFHRVLTLNPKLPEAHVNMGFAFYELGDYAGAQRFFEGALALSPALHNASYGIAISLLAQGKADQAKTAMRAYLDAIGPDHPRRKRAMEKLKEMERAASGRNTKSSEVPRIGRASKNQIEK